MVRNLILKSRSYRRFRESEVVSEQSMRDLVDLARLSPTGGNMQPLKFMIACTPEKNEQIFPHLAWAGYLKDWAGPAEGERPSAYLIILGDKEIKGGFDAEVGIAAQSILLGAVEVGLGGCMIGAIKRESFREALSIPDRFEICLVVALGKPAEKVVLEQIGPGESIEYWRDEDGVHHVPKRRIEEVLIG